MKRVAKTMQVSVNSKYTQSKPAFKTTRVATLDPIDQTESSDEPLIELEFEFNCRNFFKKSEVVYHGKSIQIDHTPSLPTTDNSAFQSIFDRKIKSCKQMCNFNYSDADISAKAMKETLLEHFVSFLTNEETCKSLSAENVQKLLEMIKVNVVRKFDSIDRIVFISEENPSVAVREWPHLQIVYQILLLTLKCYPSYIPIDFAKSMVPILNSTDENERVQVKFFIGAFCMLNGNNQNQMIVMLLKTLVDIRNNVAAPFAVSPILEIIRELSRKCDNNISSIIFENYILPLLNSQHLSFFNSEMQLTVKFFMEKEQRHVNSVVDFLLKYFPQTKMIKQVYFLNMMTEAIPKLTQRDFQNRISKIFSINGNACVSPSSKIAEAAFALWQSLEVQAIIGLFAARIFPIVVPMLFHAAHDHWAQSVRTSAQKAIDFANKTDKKLVNDINQVRNLSFLESEESKNWAKVAELAAKYDKSVDSQAVLNEFNNIKIRPECDKDWARLSKSKLPVSKNGSSIVIIQPKLCFK